MMIPDKPDKKCQHCGKVYEYKENKGFESEFMFGSINGMWHRAMYWTRIKEGHEECDLVIEQKRSDEIMNEMAKEMKRKKTKLFRTSNIPEHLLQSKTFENFNINETNKRAHDIIEGWDISDKWGVMLQGTPGTGKSHLLIALANRWINDFKEVFFLNVSDMFDDLKAGYKDNTYQVKMDMIKSVKVLILDDIGSEKPGDWVEEKFFQLLNHRMNHGLATFFSSNCTIAELKDRLHERITSRIKEMATVVILNGDDMRNSVYERRMAEIETRLQGKD